MHARAAGSQRGQSGGAGCWDDQHRPNAKTAAKALRLRSPSQVHRPSLQPQPLGMLKRRLGPFEEPIPIATPIAIPIAIPITIPITLITLIILIILITGMQEAGAVHPTHPPTFCMYSWLGWRSASALNSS